MSARSLVSGSRRSSPKHPSAVALADSPTEVQGPARTPARAGPAGEESCPRAAKNGRSSSACTWRIPARPVSVPRRLTRPGTPRATYCQWLSSWRRASMRTTSNPIAAAPSGTRSTRSGMRSSKDQPRGVRATADSQAASQSVP